LKNLKEFYFKVWKDMERYGKIWKGRRDRKGKRVQAAKHAFREFPECRELYRYVWRTLELLKDA
jgi:hypothetical protein